MLTLVALPKAFKGQFGIIQRNAIRSWTQLKPRPEIILLGTDEGVAEVCREFALTHIPEVGFSNGKPPLLGEVFQKASEAASHELICYINADILLLSDFMKAVETARALPYKFLMVSRRWDIRMDQLWSFSQPDWEQQLRAYVLSYGSQAPTPGNSDYFLFTRGLWKSFPPLIIGRGWWDHWLVYEARRLGAAVIDASPSVMAIHQSHDHLLNPSVSDLKRWRRALNANLDLIGPYAKRFTLLDSTHRLASGRVRRNFALRHWVRQVDTLPLFKPVLGFPLRLLSPLLILIRRVAHRYRKRRYAAHRVLQWVVSHLSQDGLVGIVGLADAASGEDFDQSRGRLLAHGLIWGGYPVILYDPAAEVLERARQRLRGPVTFASSLSDCAENSEILLVAARRNDVRRLLLQDLSHTSSGPALVDCCGAFDHPELVGQIRSRLPQVSFSW